MVRFLLVFAFLTTSVCCVKAQMPNAWIHHDQMYFKIPVAKDAIYRLSYLQLQQAGFPLETIDPRNIQLFHRGVEQAIHIEGEDDGTFNVADNLEFFGKKNDGTLDAELYKPASHQPHSYYNLYSDTTSYFLTVGNGAGKRMVIVQQNNTSNLPAQPFHFDEKLLVVTEQYSGGLSISNEVYTSSFDQGEGWMSLQLVQGQSRDFTFTDVTLPITTAVLPQFEMQLVGRNNAQHSVEIYVGPSFRLLLTASFQGFETHTISESLAWSDITDGKLLVRIRVVNLGTPDRVSASYLKLNYAQQTDAASATQKIFNLEQHAGGLSYLEFKNASGSRVFDITNANAVRKIATSSTATLNAVVTATDIKRKLLVTSTTLTPHIKKVGFRNISPGAHNYIIISHPLLRKAAFEYEDPVRAYASFRASEEGGSYDTLVMNTQMIYDQFNYGESSPLAVFKFLQFLSAERPPQYLFLMGKGLELWYGYYRTSPNTSEYKDFVPTSGFPGSDMFFSVGLSNTTYEPAIPTGRLPATKPEHVAAYLNKIKEMEALPFDALWRKRILHLSGGREEGEPEAFKSYLKEFQVIAEAPYFGAQVDAIAKNSRDIQVINISEEINKGLNLVTFFGHSSPSTLDFDIGYVSNPVMGYNNKGKYPMLLMNGCEAGAFFLKSKLFGEDWILADKKGASGFIAHTSYGLVSTLKLYSKSFYEVAYGDSVYLRKGIGDIQKQTAKKYMEQAFPFLTHLAQIQQMILLGDPAVKLFGAAKPDFQIANGDLSIISFNDRPVTALADSFALKLVVRNYGQSRAEPFRIEVVRTLNDNTTIAYDSILQTPRFSDTITFVIRKGKESGFGNNTFTVNLDADNIIAEMNENNNSASIDFFMPLNGTKNLYPVNYAIVNSPTVNVTFQTTDLYSSERAFILEVDTVSTFDSPYKQHFNVQAKVLAKKEIQLLTIDTTAYYWRTRLAQPLPGENDLWEVTSFTYINNGSEGWAQVHFPQLADDPVTGLVKDQNSRRITFQKSVNPVSVTTFGANAGKPRDSVSVKIAGAEFNLFNQAGGYYACRTNTVNLIAFNRSSTVPYPGIDLKWYEIVFQYGARLCGRVPYVINSFQWNEIKTGAKDLMEYINNVAEGDSVLVYTSGDAYFNLWPAEGKVKIGEIGISESQFNAFTPGEPVVIFGKKGSAPGSARVYRASGLPANTAKLVVNQTITGGYTTGSLESTIIGPAQGWQQLTWKVDEIENQDIVSFDVVGFSLKGEQQLLLQNVSGAQDLSGIDANQFPYLKIIFNTTDELLLSSPQLAKWLVLYTPVPEGILLPVDGVQQMFLNEGEKWNGKFNYINISDKAFADSLKVNFSVFNVTKRAESTQTFRIKSPLPGDTAKIKLDFNTTAFGGSNNFELVVNPRILPEQYYDNNVIQLQRYLEVIQDLNAPVLDVTIDGRYVVNGDFVSPTPKIIIKLWDDNPILLKTDTAGMRVFLTYPCNQPVCEAKYISLRSGPVKWFPASADQDFRIEFKPDKLPEGSYKLRVEAADAKGNMASRDPYEIEFKVVYETALSFIDPHPNPFTHEQYFGFTLSGSVLPDQLSITIVDVMGKSVYGLQMTERNAFFIGQNVFHWKGLDNKGNLLPAGMYLFTFDLIVDKQRVKKQGKLIISR